MLEKSEATILFLGYIDYLVTIDAREARSNHIIPGPYSYLVTIDARGVRGHHIIPGLYRLSSHH